MSLAEIEQTITKLGNLSEKQGELRSVAEKVKQQQQRLKLSVDGAVKIMAAFRGSSQAMAAILERAKAEERQQKQYINDLIALLKQEPTKDDIDRSINDLKTISEQGMEPEQINQLVRDSGLTPDEITAIGINNGQPAPPAPPVPPAQPGAQEPQGPGAGGFNWRSAVRKSRTRKNSKKKIRRTRSGRTSRSNSIRRSKRKSKSKSN